MLDSISLNRSLIINFNPDNVFCVSPDNVISENDRDFFYVIPIELNSLLAENITHFSLSFQSNESFKNRFKNDNIFNLTSNNNFSKFESNQDLSNNIKNTNIQNILLNYKQKNVQNINNSYRKFEFKDLRGKYNINNSFDKNTFFLTLSRSFSNTITDRHQEKLRITFYKENNVVDYTDFVYLNFVDRRNQNLVENVNFFYENIFSDQSINLRFDNSDVPKIILSNIPLNILQNYVSENNTIQHIPKRFKITLKYKEFECFTSLFDRPNEDHDAVSNWLEINNSGNQQIFNEATNEITLTSQNFHTIYTIPGMTSSGNVNSFKQLIDNLVFDANFNKNQNNFIIDIKIEIGNEYSVTDPLTIDNIQYKLNRSQLSSLSLRYISNFKRRKLKNPLINSNNLTFGFESLIEGNTNPDIIKLFFTCGNLNDQDLKFLDLVKIEKIEIVEEADLNADGFNSNDIVLADITNYLYSNSSLQEVDKINITENTIKNLFENSDVISFWISKIAQRVNTSLRNQRIDVRNDKNKIKITFKCNIKNNNFGADNNYDKFYYYTSFDNSSSSSIQTNANNLISSISETNIIFSRNIQLGEVLTSPSINENNNHFYKYSNIFLVNLNEFKQLALRYSYFLEEGNNSEGDHISFLKNCVAKISVGANLQKELNHSSNAFSVFNNKNFFLDDFFDFSTVNDNFLRVRDTILNQIINIGNENTGFSDNISNESFLRIIFSLKIKILPIPKRIIQYRHCSVNNDQKELFRSNSNCGDHAGSQNVVTKSEQIATNFDILNYLFDNTSTPMTSIGSLNIIKAQIFGKDENTEKNADDYANNIYTRNLNLFNGFFISRSTQSL